MLLIRLKVLEYLAELGKLQLDVFYFVNFVFFVNMG